MNWQAARERDAADRILASAAELFARDGVAAVGMAELAQAAGCSRATLYRYFPNRQALHAAFIQREARAVAVAVRDRTSGIADPGERLLRALQIAVEEVRGAPPLAAWFAVDEPPAGGIASRSAGIEAVAFGLLTEITGADAPESAPAAARWLVRVVVSLLSHPEPDASAEEELLRRFVIPAVLTDPALAATVRG
ncbi:Transcriptional regulator, TetR family OS=Tsukamurella paurometabola (strain ATCC 8368 / DSM/ CCUG 35730 / CIP 100753 / JCM 10117 / KCTC 9821 / NBRC 16120/ NCIMB 702349 / NCTC 13040) OX=521096 GN=Tpau_3779 PE=4 SV=1 [Tsukamurella paurometabola]|uniref:Transcriptional regulator, TetR family n=1 Tax=Tsukamurella paurometabola (strain ATCC 8368 / DSM 20162 / CCUG 35730 / CIP 100753 / JCM 10117 / KCTC 9821 / NBRC 16120 / NCIMB 702349 / NCTC 13040) TaxID=521096 RepID=D5UYQ4_TSUPD|nr:TetR/AcrR family transcriptional regulator [Tsukamurella paurometabola]ADG80357.1 transcriptional regulator, TetR family [Tsukamurella paurometabola DSM 20162]SUP39349.1 DNA-binding transcriptional repressor AcrR [Tsukamurella paurometabola]